MVKYYTASKSRNQGRDSWSVIFRHPVRIDTSTGKPGRRIRRGLGTSDDAEADALVEELNTLLSTPSFWEPSARSTAESRFDERVIEIFFGDMESAHPDFLALREQILPLPGEDEGFRKVMLLGTTGAGKTTVVRQLLGTDPKIERFPSTSTAKTTVADTELVLSESGPYNAVVTFASRDEVIDYLTENVSEAAMTAFKGKDDAAVVRRLLDHVNQRFRFSYVLGRPMLEDDQDAVVDEEDDEDVAETDFDPGEFGEIDVEESVKVVMASVGALRDVVERHAEELRLMLAEVEDDERVVAEFIEEELDAELRQSEEFHKIVDSLLDQIEKRFAALDVGHLRRNRQGWPVSWTWSTEDRSEFLKRLTPFASNYAPLFGRLLTPLVNGIRVLGPFHPRWSDASPPLVLIDGEGLGHTPNSASTLSTSVAKRLDDVDSVLLVDNAAQPMQAAPVAAMKALAVSGNAAKLVFLFTHFDQVTGANLPTFSAREEHVLASAENVLKAIADELGPAAERQLRSRLEEARFFVGGIQKRLRPDKQKDRRSIEQLAVMLDTLVTEEQPAETGTSRPVFDRMNLSLAVTEAAKAFHAKWRGLLGLEFNPSAPKEHWTRVKALSRRLAEGWVDEYDTLKPVADLRFELQLQIYLMLQRPVEWTHGEPDDDTKQALLDELSNAITRRLFDLTRQRLAEDALLAWQNAYVQRGQGSTFVRARIIANDVYDRAAPVPTVAASPDQNRFLQAVADAVSAVAAEFEVQLM